MAASSRLSAESITAIAAVVTAFVALAVGVWQVSETRRHNRLSVRPLLDFRTQVEMRSLDSAVVGFYITNRGLGLAEVENMGIEVAPRSGEPQTYETWTEAAPLIEGFGPTMGSRSDLGPGTLIEPGETVTVLELRSEGQLRADSLLAVIRRIRADVRYRSLYEEVFSASTGESAQR